MRLTPGIRSVRTAYGDIRENREGAPDIPECHITKSGQEPFTVVISLSLFVIARSEGRGV